jgi:hypothetical protein
VKRNAIAAAIFDKFSTSLITLNAPGQENTL